MSKRRSMDEEELRATRMGQEEHPGSKKNGKSQGWPGGPNLLKALRFVLLLPHVAVSAHCTYILIFYLYKISACRAHPAAGIGDRGLDPERLQGPASNCSCSCKTRPWSEQLAFSESSDQRSSSSGSSLQTSKGARGQNLPGWRV